MVRPIPYPEIYPPEDPSYHPIGTARTMFVDEVDRAGIDMMLDRLEASDATMRAVQLRVLGGAMARISNEATAFAHRDRALMVNVAALYESFDERDRHTAWVDALAESLQRGPVGAYSGFLGDEGEARVHDAYPKPTWDRLAEIKARYDPTNLFHLNQNVPPAA
jgi:FAD/FMN-containing dehydrogenase